MDEILALQAELARVQEAPTAFKLSEPNIVEIVSTLSQLRLVDVLFTTNGKEYLTPEQLLREVGDEILSHGGRVNVADLPALLNVDLPHIERAVTQLLAAGRDGLQRVGGEVLTEYYLDSLAEEIDTALRGVGRLTLAEVAVAHALSTDFVTSALFYEAVGGLHAAGRLAGTLQAKTSFTPAVHRLAQAAAAAQERLAHAATTAQLACRALPAALERATLKGPCADWLTALLQCEALHRGLDAARAEELGEEGGGSGADAFLEAMWAMDGALGDQSPRLDKKRERAALDRARAGYREQLAVETAPAAVLHLSVLLLEAR
ncbi:hypothetical protein EMIHUDRAFT_234696 [Emiliania huxleyi CCMP1516]|uniref:E3 UFM1-protein ligase 1-like N-terminal domain-containing protein n=2 Tax=Emiliania huxleyi TaxID=2903 RepID=A0A0D3JYY3_EMIH1|nr:hypothetical protein EMIHUDRAFT_234696 [Emiliania huxleyi CCMP1516]EOD28718.1 hypothetical protein EMIHUDRAFT_234696 [Emiliania huxleyi CCMP1516]|eukprot:XP_005781147.1 hypothetical protein EMIHUDRAFT_234696 [Emiliania huxleyi CCMP1516]